MTPTATPGDERSRVRRARLAVALIDLALRVSVPLGPRPGALLMRRLFAAGGAQTARSLARHAPADVVVTRDEPYGSGPDAVLDVYRPPDAEGPLPTVVWIHGGGWIGGSKEELAGWFALIADHGYAVVAPRYTLAPKAHYPGPQRQLMEVLAHLRRDAERLGVDPARIVLAGDSAGAQIAAQTAALATTPGYGDAVGVRPTIAAASLRGVVLACGPYDLALLDADPATEASERSRAANGSIAAARRLGRAMLWAYSGDRRYARNRHFATASVAAHVTGAFPPALVTVGNADPLRAHSELLAERLRDAGAPVETCFFPDDHAPPLGHEYQFDLDADAGRAFLARMLAFLERQLAPAAPPRPARPARSDGSSAPTSRLRSDEVHRPAA